MFQSCTAARSALPSVAIARMKFIVAALLAYARTMRAGSGVRSPCRSFTASPRYDARPVPLSTSLLRGLAYWPARRPTFTTGTEAPYVSTTAICSRVRTLPRMPSAVFARNVSAQSPPCSRNASPRATAASRSRRTSHSPGCTSGGTWLSVS